MTGLVFRRPRSLPEALDELAADEALVMAGGQSLVLLMNAGLLEPERLVSIAGLPELRGVHETDDGLDIGACCRHQELAELPVIGKRLPAVARMFQGVGNVRVRNAGTLGGNLVHADPAQDPPVLLAALGAYASVVGPGGERTLPVEDVAAGPLWSSLADDELLTRVQIPWLDNGTRAAYIKFLPGTLDDYATVSVGVRLTLGSDGTVSGLRVAAGAVGPTVAVLDEAASVLVGRAPDDDDALVEFADRVRDSVSPYADRRGSADYKREMAGVVARRAVQACLQPDAGPAGRED